MKTVLALVAMASFAVAGCDQPSQGPARTQAEAVPSLTTGDSPRLLKTTTVSPYPEAVTVRLFVRGEKAFEGGPDYVEAAGRPLSRVDREALERTLKIVSYDRPPDAVAACFVPHHFIRYFDGRGQEIGEIAVCLCCHGARAKPEVAGQAPEGAGDHYLDFDEPEFRRVVTEMGLPTDVGC